MPGLLLDRDGAIATLTLNRPESANAVDESVVSAWEGALDAIVRDAGVRVVILTGAGERAFCAGGDLDWFASMPDRAAGEAMSRRVTALLDRMWRLDIPVIAAVNGAAFGGGCEVLTACHMRIAADTARFAFRQAAMGVVTGWGGADRLFRMIGRGPAMRLLLTADTVDAPAALRLGLIDEVLSPAELLPGARLLAERVIACAPAAVSGFLELARAPGDDVARLEHAMFADLWGAPEGSRRIGEAARRRR